MERPPAGIVALTAFFVIGAVMSGMSAFLLLVPGTPLDAVWGANPDAGTRLASLGAWGIALMATVCVACTLTAVGLRRRTRWGHRLAIGMLAVNMVGDVANAVVRDDRRTLVGVLIGGALIAYLMTRRVRNSFNADI